jgi:hypothetical protein
VGGTPIIPPPGQPGPLQQGEFVQSGPANVVSFRLQDIGPPSSLYIQRDDSLTVMMVAGQVTNERCTIQARLLRPDGVIVSIEQNLPYAGAAYSRQFFNTPLAEGYLLSLTVGSTAAQFAGQTFVRAYIVRGKPNALPASSHYLLASGYVTVNLPVSWPGGRLLLGQEGDGYLYAPQITSPSAGADFTFTMPSSVRWRVQSINAQLITSAGAGSRLPQIQIQTAGGNTVWMAPPSQAVPASTTAQVSMSSSQVSAVTVPTLVSISLPAPLMIMPGFKINSVTSGLLAGDQWGNIFMMVEEWLDQAV